MKKCSQFLAIILFLFFFLLLLTFWLHCLCKSTIQWVWFAHLFIPFICINAFHCVLFQWCSVFHTSAYWFLNLKQEGIWEWWCNLVFFFIRIFQQKMNKIPNKIEKSVRTSSCLYFSLSLLICRLYDCKMFEGGDWFSVFLIGVSGGCWVVGSVDDTKYRFKKKLFKNCAKNSFISR